MHDTPGDDGAELVGRATELGILRDHVHDLRLFGAFVVVRGPSGIGKTALLDAACDAVTGLPGQVVRMSMGRELSEVPLGPVRAACRRLLQRHPEAEELLRGLRPGLASLLPEYADQPGAAAESLGTTEALAGRTNEAVCELFRRLASARPTVVVLDDLQWADRASLNLLRWMLRQLREDPILFLGALREDEADLAAETLAVAALGTSISVGPLSELESRRLLAASLPRGANVSVDDATSVVEIAEGNPLFIIQAARAVGEGHPLVSLSDGLPAVLRARVRALDPSLRPLLSAAAVLGPDIELEQASQLLEKPAEAIESAVRAGLEAGLLKRDAADNHLRFAHSLAREAVLEDLLPSERARLHGKALAILTSGNVRAEAAQLAAHAEGAGDSAAFIRFATEAATEAEQRGAFHEASKQYDGLIAAFDVKGETIPTLALAQAARVWLAAGRARRAATMLLDLAERHAAAGDLFAEAMATAHSVRAQPTQESVVRLQAVISRLEPLGESAALATALATLVHVLTGTLSAGSRSVVDSSDRALRIARTTGSAEALAIALLARGHILANAFDFDAGCALLEECLAAATAPEESREEHAAAVNLTSLLTKAARWDAAARQAQLGAERALERGAYRRAGQLLARLSDVEQWRGNWTASRAAAEDALLLVDEDDRQAARAARYALAVCLVLDHAWADAERHISAETAEANWNFFPHGPFLALRMRLQSGTGNHRAAVETGRSLHELWLRSSDAFYGISFSALFVELLCGTGLFSEAQDVLAQSQRRLEWLPPELRPLPRAAIVMQRAHIAQDSKPAASLNDFLEAEEKYRDLAAPYQQARAAISAARFALGQKGNFARSTARSALTRAHELLTDLGSPEAAETDALLRKMRWARGLKHTPGVLTRREAEVASLVAEGLTNQQIAERLVLSRRTVDNHVARMFEKVGVHTRTALAREVRVGRVRGSIEK